MSTDDLVDLIAKRVMELLASQKKETSTPEKATVLVVGNSDNTLDFEPKPGKNFSFTMAEDLDKPDPADFDHIVLASLSNSLLSALVVGLERGSEGCLILESLLLGKTVHILEEGIAYRRYRETAKPALYSVFEQKEKTLKSYGTAVVARENLEVFLANTVDGNSLPDTALESEITDQAGGADSHPSQDDDVMVLDQRVIAEKDLIRLYEKGCRKVARGRRSLLTPLARDFIRIHEDLVVLEKV